MKKKIICTVMALSLAGLLIACGSKDTSGAAESQDAPVSMAFSEETETEPETKSPASAEESESETKEPEKTEESTTISSEGEEKPVDMKQKDEKKTTSESTEKPKSTEASKPKETGSSASKPQSTGSSSETGNTGSTQATGNTGSTGGTSNNSTPPPAHTHSYDGGTVTKAATYSEEGVKTYVCSCGSSYSEAIPKLTCNHETYSLSYSGSFYPEPTCDRSGYALVTCTICGEGISSKFGGGITTPALGHVEEIRVTMEATCGTMGHSTVWCTRCNREVDYRDIPATGNHNPKEVTFQVDKDTWETWSVCQTCGMYLQKLN